MTAGSDELVVLLGDDGQPLGTALKATVHHSETPLHLAFSCYVFDPAGRFLLTRRAFAKKTWPGVWTNSCCGHPAPGEPVEDAVKRRVTQELGTELTGIRLLLPDFRYRAVMDDGTVENELCPVYAATCPDPGSLAPDPAEVAEVKWVDWAGFHRDVLVSSREVSPWCALQVAALPEDPRSFEHGVG